MKNAQAWSVLLNSKYIVKKRVNLDKLTVVIIYGRYWSPQYGGKGLLKSNTEFCPNYHRWRLLMAFSHSVQRKWNGVSPNTTGFVLATEKNLTPKTQQSFCFCILI